MTCPVTDASIASTWSWWVFFPIFRWTFLMNFFGELFWWSFMVNFLGELYWWAFWWAFWGNFLSNFQVNFFDELFGELFWWTYMVKFLGEFLGDWCINCINVVLVSFLLYFYLSRSSWPRSSSKISTIILIEMSKEICGQLFFRQEFLKNSEDKDKTT